MKKLLTRLVAACAIPYALSALVCLLPLSETPALIASLAFGAIEMLLSAVLLYRTDDLELQFVYSRLMGVAFCLAAQLGVSIVVGLEVVSGAAALLLSCAPMTAAVFLTLLAGSWTNTIEDVETKRDASIGHMKDLLLNLEDALPDCPAELATDLSELIEEVRYSDPVSTEGVGSIEQQMIVTLMEFKSEPTKTSIDRIAALLESRNRRLRAGK